MLQEPAGRRVVGLLAGHGRGAGMVLKTVGVHAAAGSGFETKAGYHKAVAGEGVQDAAWSMRRREARERAAADAAGSWFGADAGFLETTAGELARLLADQSAGTALMEFIGEDYSPETA